MKLITKDILRKEALKSGIEYKAPLYKNAVSYDSRDMEVISEQRFVVENQNYKSPYDRKNKNGKMILDAIKNVDLAQHNPSDLQDFIAATILDVSRKVATEPLLHTFVYNVNVDPNAAKVTQLNDTLEQGMVFGEMEGSGDSVKMGKQGVTSSETMTQQIRGVGWANDYNFKLYNTLFKADQLNDAVARGYAASINDTHLLPIINGTYAGAKATGASSTGDTWQEKVYNTIMNGRRDLGKRIDPDTKKKIDNTGLVLLTSKSNAVDIEWVIRGQLNKYADAKNLASIPGINAVIGYDGDVITVGGKTYTFTGVTSGTCYLIKPTSRAFSSLFKRTLTKLELSWVNPLTLVGEEKSWHYINAIYNTFGITNQVQELTLPTIS